MPKYVIEREMPDVGSLSVEQLRGAAQSSCAVIAEMGHRVQWVQSYVTGNKIYCIHIAPDEAAVREHARQGGLSANCVAEVTTIIDPTTAEG